MDANQEQYATSKSQPSKPSMSTQDSSSSAGSMPSASHSAKHTVPLRQLRPEPQWIDCPKCGQTAQTQIQCRSEGKQKFMNVFWWPLPGRKHWWEKTRWLCGNCNEELAMQKFNDDLQILV
ncbi:LITAF-like zinc ribbon domain-containing protein [Purpureocillium lilacinum]|uniref:LITAF-like zinc ribbon domain-containing protein n=2 Tax=Purpureocillium lilacinum TaxID=33203 RepID=A0A179GX75_PURLI|nr:LITAF-like zinc ribbon domain-containing protein [Purpureocillium lilacinum]KAK4084789.1 hypothetical protein Purlil1_10195 [Purpureocillium lilacinum]OAQ74470.1 LITAF-like zinc ribbon domain-containing protein [Purpureocillium lilacinum]OAQ82576.1 LITAF-like zinc ribbon domain-containing protein [Purpureocillium lilacinum]PWI72209.1 LPS-induced tumor necrosis factor alpha factor [Purpureocillium lilacinum]GJN71078.1 hypothetical protein PLICBS_005140 [Purpureocillium lilacinum]